MILFSYDIFSAQPTGGISRCMVELMSALAPEAIDWRLWVGGPGNALLDDALEDPDFASRAFLSSSNQARGRLATAIKSEPSFAAAATALGATVIHRTYYPFVDLAPRRLPRFETLHDMWDERVPRQGLAARAKSSIKRRALERADIIVCVSESTKNELADVWPSLSAKARVIHHGARRLSADPEPIDAKRPYFLFVGRRGEYKNFRILISALRASGLADHDLIAFGGGKFDTEERAAIEAAGLGERILQTGGSDRRLSGYYQSATALLYPSSYEGFGLPVLEAMIHDCPVIAAPLTSLPEVGGDAALYADPVQAEAWAELMRRLAADTDFANDMRCRGHARAAQFTWSLTAQKHAALYREAEKSSSW